MRRAKVAGTSQALPETLMEKALSVNGEE